MDVGLTLFTIYCDLFLPLAPTLIAHIVAATASTTILLFCYFAANKVHHAPSTLFCAAPANQARQGEHQKSRHSISPPSSPFSLDLIGPSAKPNFFLFFGWLVFMCLSTSVHLAHAKK